MAQQLVGLGLRKGSSHIVSVGQKGVSSELAATLGLSLAAGDQVQTPPLQNLLERLSNQFSS